MPDRAPVPRGTRPRNRRELILAAAADLFAKHGARLLGLPEAGGDHRTELV
jgi:AcrR family transcriptional regulator